VRPTRRKRELHLFGAAGSTSAIRSNTMAGYRAALAFCPVYVAGI
jgi:hypothetical protein